MQYAIVSDIHANLQAWNAALMEIRSLGVDRILCLGDVVGYGPNPCEVLESVYTSVDHLVMGNHDAALCGKLDAGLFNDNARRILDWTRERLGASAMAFLKTFPLTLAGCGFRCAHGDFSDPGRFHYIIEPEDAPPSWQAADEPLLFHGHTHRAGIYVVGNSGKPHWLPPEDFELEDGKRYLVNAGSVGSPRDGDARGSFCLYDDRARAVYWRRVPFDLDAFRTALTNAGLPSSPSHFLQKDPRAAVLPLRTLLSFRSPAAEEPAARDVVQVEAIRRLQSRLRRWRGLAVGILALGLAAAGVGGWTWMQRPRSAVIGSVGRVEARSVAMEQNLLTFPPQLIPAGEPIAGWQIRLGDRKRQTVELALTPDAELVLTSGNPTVELQAVSDSIEVRDDMKFRLEGMFLKGDDFKGTIQVAVSVVKLAGGREETVDPYLIKEPNQSRRGGWWLAQQTFELPAGARSFRVKLVGKFQGAVRVKELSLTRKP